VGQEVVDAAVYTDGRVLVLLQPAGAGGKGGGGSSGGGEVGLYKLNPVETYSWKATWFQPLSLSGDLLVSKFAFTFKLYRYSEGGEGGDQPASVVMVDPSELPGASGYVAVAVHGTAAAPPLGCVPSSGVTHVPPASAEGGGREDGVRYRSLPGLEATPPLAVGPSKGLAAVLVGSRRIVLLDLEEDECDEEDSDADDED
jgi:hypothetical protein